MDSKPGPSHYSSLSSHTQTSKEVTMFLPPLGTHLMDLPSICSLSEYLIISDKVM